MALPGSGVVNRFVNEVSGSGVEPAPLSVQPPSLCVSWLSYGSGSGGAEGAGSKPITLSMPFVVDVFGSSTDIMSAAPATLPRCEPGEVAGE